MLTADRLCSAHLQQTSSSTWKQTPFKVQNSTQSKSVLRSRASSALKAIYHYLRTPLLAAHYKVPRSIAMLSGQGCLNDILYQHLEGGGYDVLVLNYEFAGDGVHRKVEVMQVHDAPLFDKDGVSCPFNRSMRCLHCGNRTPLTRRTCGESPRLR